MPITSTPWLRTPLATYGLSALLTAAFCAWLFPLSFVLGHGGFFQDGDTAQHVSGWLLFAADQWRMPLLETQRIAPPDGLAIFLTDSIPLAALAFKPFASWLPDGFHYFGIWQVLVKFGQAIGMVFLLRGLGARTLPAAFFGTILALFWPVAIFRMGHTGLATHAVILFALAFYARASLSAWSDAKSYTAFAAISVIALLVHPYLLAMVLSIVCAFTIDRVWRGPHRIGAILGLAATAIVLLLVLLPTGYLARSPAGIGGFTLYSMNVLSTVCGGDLSPCGLMNMDGGQYEGFNNIGMGLILLIPFALWLGRREILPALAATPGIVLLCIGLTIYALSSKIWFGPYLVLEYPVPLALEPLTQIFRVPGRFFWPVGYILLAATLVIVLRHANRGWMLGLLAVATVLQVGDVRSALRNAYIEVHRPETVDFARWDRALPGIAHVQVFPRYGCVPIEDAPYAFLQLLAGEIGATISTAYQPRPDQDCDGVLKENPELPAPDTLLVSLADQAGLPQPANVATSMASGNCAKVPAAGVELLMCTSAPVDWSQLKAQVKEAQ